ncbi:MAG: PP2C family protein-serine/threonine phosphatase [Pseudomonadota bacterium]
MSEAETSTDQTAPAAADERAESSGDLGEQLARARAEIDHLKAELSDLNLLYEATIAHGEAVEDQLAENNTLLEQTQARLAEELQDATRYVMSILPEPRKADPETDWLLIPSTELGGDSFGHHDIDEDHFAIYLLDVCGHGVGAALLSIAVINVLRACALPEADFKDPAAVLTALNNAFPMEKQNNMFFTIWYGVYRRSTGTLRCASGGHPPSIHLRPDGDGKRIARAIPEVGGMAMGAIEDMDYECEEIAILPGDRLLVLSDGTFEIGVPGEEPAMLSYEDLVAFTLVGEGDRPSSVLDWVRSLHGEGPLPDDFSLLRVQF